MSDGKEVVLVVEDDTIIRMGAVEVVEASGYEAVEGRDADDALSILEARVDIGLVFYRRPDAGFDGWNGTGWPGPLPVA